MESDGHEKWKCADQGLERRIRCFPWVELSDVPRLRQVDGCHRTWRSFGLGMPVPSQGHYGFHSFRLLTDFVCLYYYEFCLSLCKIVRSSLILLLPLSGGMDSCIYVNMYIGIWWYGLLYIC
jgi:hypothetical protein